MNFCLHYFLPLGLLLKNPAAKQGHSLGNMEGVKVGYCKLLPGIVSSSRVHSLQPLKHFDDINNKWKSQMNWFWHDGIKL